MSILRTAFELSKFAPDILKWLGGKRAETVSGIVYDIAKKVSNSQNEDELLKKMDSDYNLTLEFRRALLEAERDIEMAIMRDKESARSRDVAIVNSGRRNKRADIMVIAAGFGLVSCLFVIASYQNNLPGEAIGIISTIAGIFGSCLKDAYTFEFGSSRGSKEKDYTVASIIRKI
jgi:hypothetical protein